jgi:tetratricopeptide (TPR) repeat protein
MPIDDRIRLLLERGNAARRAGQFSEASQHLNAALAMCGPGQDFSRACVLRELGELSRNVGNHRAAQEYYEQAVVLLRVSDDPDKLAHTIRHLGDVHAKQQQWAEAEKCFEEALDIYRGLPSPDVLDLASTGTAISLGNPSSSLTAIRVSRSVPAPRRRARSPSSACDRADPPASVICRSSPARPAARTSSR